MQRRFSIRFLLLITAIIAGIFALVELKPWKDQRFRPAATRSYESYCRRIVAELTSENTTDECGCYICISRNHAMWIAMGKEHWVYEFHQFTECAPKAYDRNFGRYSLEHETLTLAARFQSDTLPDELHIVDWGDRRYLLCETEFEAFREAVESGAEPRNAIEGEFLLRRGDEQKQVSGMPQLPD